MTNLAARFATQNPTFVAGLDPDEMEEVAAFADHHSGGLIVLWRPHDDGVHMVKAHDSWGGPDDEGRECVVHVYNPEEPDDEEVTYYATGHEALGAFMLLGPAD